MRDAGCGSALPRPPCARPAADHRSTRLRRVSRALSRLRSRAPADGKGVRRAVLRGEGKGRALLLAVPNTHFGLAWAALCAGFAIHVADEALTDFLSVYNPAVRAIRARFPFLPLPTFTFRVWLTGLVLAVGVLASLTPFAIRGAPWMRPIAYAFGIVMAGHGLRPPVGAGFMREAAPAGYPGPLLRAPGLYLGAAACHPSVRGAA